MDTAEQAILAFTDALYAFRFEEAAAFLYPGDVERLRVMMLNCSKALEAFGEGNWLVSALGMQPEDLADDAVFGPRMLEGTMGKARTMAAGLDLNIEQEIARVEESGDSAKITVRTVATLLPGADPRLHECLPPRRSTEKTHHLQRFGDRWYVMLGREFQLYVDRVRHEISAFQERAARDQPPPPSSGETGAGLSSFRLHGFRDAAHRTVIEPRFTGACDFSEGLAAVRFFNCWGYIDAAGRTVIQPAFSDASSFSEGLAAVAVEDDDGDTERWGYIDPLGAFVIPPQFEKGRDFQENRAAVRQSDLWGYVDAAGLLVIPCQFTEAGDFEDGTAAVEDKDGETQLIDPWGHPPKDDPEDDDDEDEEDEEDSDEED